MRFLLRNKLIRKMISVFTCSCGEVISFFFCLKYYLLSQKKDKYIFIQAWVNVRFGKVIHNNWGDDINIFFLEELTGKKVIILPQTRSSRLFTIKNYVFIGSCIEYANRKKSIVFGSGLMNDKINYPLPKKDTKFIAVRGPLTAEWLKINGYSCPRVYGDPALLISYFYKPKMEKKYRISYIPHHTEFISNPEIINYFKNLGIHIIRVTSYGNWKEFIEDICASEYVLSSSLHGLIISESYNIPNTWTCSSNQIEGFNFKFYDFYESINKPNMKPLFISTTSKIDDLNLEKENWYSTKDCVEKVKKALLDNFPFTIKKEISSF